MCPKPDRICHICSVDHAYSSAAENSPQQMPDFPLSDQFLKTAVASCFSKPPSLFHVRLFIFKDFCVQQDQWAHEDQSENITGFALHMGLVDRLQDIVNLILLNERITPLLLLSCCSAPKADGESEPSVQQEDRLTHSNQFKAMKGEKPRKVSTCATTPVYTELLVIQTSQSS